MKISIGIDVGTSTTKIVGVREGKVIKSLRTKVTDPTTSLYGAFGKYLYDNRTDLSDVERVMLTGAGVHHTDKPVYGLPTAEVNELLVDGLGAQFESKLQRMIMVSMGTGTSLVLCDSSEVRHTGGINIGGGTLSGLSRLLLQTDNIDEIIALTDKGDISRINLQIKGISISSLPGLPTDVTVSLFANAQANAGRKDTALGLIGLVLQSTGSATILGSLNSDTRDFVPIGNLSLLPQCKLLFPVMEKIYGIRFIVPKNSEYCMVIDAALQANNIEIV